MNGETGPSTSGAWLDKSSVESVIKLDSDLSCLHKTKMEKKIVNGIHHAANLRFECVT